MLQKVAVPVPKIAPKRKINSSGAGCKAIFECNEAEMRIDAALGRFFMANVNVDVVTKIRIVILPYLFEIRNSRGKSTVYGHDFFRFLPYSLRGRITSNLYLP